MKKCKSCGALQKDDRTTCIDCGEHLGAPLSDNELKAVETLFQEQLEKTTEDTPEFQVTKFDFVLIILHALLTIAITVLAFINPNGDTEIGLTLLFVLIGNIVCLVDLAFPNIVWELRAPKLSFRSAFVNGFNPQAAWTVGRKIASIIFIIVDAIIIFDIIR